MEIVITGVDILKSIGTAIGGGTAMMGLFNFFQGQSDNNAASLQKGISQFIGGAGIILISQTLIPMFGTMVH